MEEFSDKITINAYLHATLTVFDTNALKFLNVSLEANFAGYYPNLFDKSDSQTLEHKKETARIDVLSLKIAFALPISTALYERFFSVIKVFKIT